MVSKTIAELRALAKSRGLKGYSKLSLAELRRMLAPPKKKATPKTKKSKPASRKTAAKPAARSSRRAPTKKTAVRLAPVPAASGSTHAELQRVLAPPKKPAASKARKSKPAARKTAAKPAARSSRRTPAKKPAVRPAPVPAVSGSMHEEPAVNLMPGAARLSSDEERVEDAKYAVAPRGIAVSLRPSVTDLGEDIDRLPVLREPALCLLPQKPGVLHAYWVLEPGATARQPGMKLRLCRIADDTLHVLQEIPLPGERGHWYFHIDDQSEPGGFYAHLGYYRDTGEFVTAIHRGIARIPGLYASGRTDRQWWISDRKFREMYLRAGGFVAGAQLGWTASIGSPRGGERLGWANAISSGKR